MTVRTVDKVVKGERVTVSIERMFPSGALKLSTVHAGQLKHITFHGHRQGEALVAFLAYLKS